jgi:O-antigen ligase
MRGGVWIWKSSPIFGVGINNVRHSTEARHYLFDAESGSVDSGLLQVLVEQGIVGFSALAVVLILLWKPLRAAWSREEEPARHWLLWFLMWALAADVVNSLVTHPWHHPQRWLIICMAASYLAYRESSTSVGRPAESPSRSVPT